MSDLHEELRRITREAEVKMVSDSITRPNRFYEYLAHGVPLPRAPLHRRVLYRLGWYEARYRVGRAWAALRGIEAADE